MEDQGKRLLITVGLVAVLYLVWTTFFMPKPEPQAQAPAPQPPAATAPGPNAAAPAAPNAALAAPAAAGETPAAPPALCDPSKEQNPPRWETPDFVATFSRCGGALESFVLLGSQYRVTEKELGKEHGEPHQIDLVRTEGNPSYFPLQVQVDTAPVGSASPDDRRQPAIPARA